MEQPVSEIEPTPAPTPRRAKRLAIVPPPVVAGPPRAIISSDLLAAAVRAVRCAVATDDTRPVLAGIHFEKGYAIAADGYRLARYALDLGNVNATVRLPDLELAAKYHDVNLIVTQESGDRLTIEGIPWGGSGTTTAYCRLIPGTYPSHVAMFPHAATLTMVVPAAPLRWIASGARVVERFGMVPMAQWGKYGKQTWKTATVKLPRLKLTLAPGTGELTMWAEESGETLTLKVGVEPPPAPPAPEIPKKMGKREAARVLAEYAASESARLAAFAAQPPLAMWVNAEYLAGLLAPLPPKASLRIALTRPNAALTLTSPELVAWGALLMPMLRK